MRKIKGDGEDRTRKVARGGRRVRKMRTRESGSLVGSVMLTLHVLSEWKFQTACMQSCNCISYRTISMLMIKLFTCERREYEFILRHTGSFFCSFMEAHTPPHSHDKHTYKI